ncbi:hypothetical protein [Pontibacter beigongshangensis]|uniref:hypothetical protein n=1 Tax=Pontibacter beigongshangensis TaxID=2574733 RepID=UPI001650C977|nr:hypothetical protein [Pontibacter beigongshangensis]
MIQLLCEELAQEIRKANIVWLAGGLASAWKYNDSKKHTKAVYWDYARKEHVNLVPDAERHAMVYFEERGATQLQEPRLGQKYKADLVLIGWVNTRFGVVTPYLIEQLQKVFKSPINTTTFSQVMVRFTELLPEGEQLFSRYDYDAGVKKYLQKPYDAFGLRMSVSFTVCVPADYQTPRQFDDSFNNSFT